MNYHCINGDNNFVKTFRFSCTNTSSFSSRTSERMDIDQLSFNLTHSNCSTYEESAIGLYLYILIMVHCHSTVIAFPFIVLYWIRHTNSNDPTVKLRSRKLLLISAIECISLKPCLVLASLIVSIFDLKHPFVESSLALLSALSIFVSTRYYNTGLFYHYSRWQRS